MKNKVKLKLIKITILLEEISYKLKIYKEWMKLQVKKLDLFVVF